MITVKSNSLTDDEKIALSSIMAHSYRLFLDTMCQRNCSRCKYSRLCYDLEHCYQYCDKIAERSSQNDNR